MTEKTMAELIEALRVKREALRQGGGAGRLAKQTEQGKLTARERIESNVAASTIALWRPVNVGFSRAKERVMIFHSKPLGDFKGSVSDALLHFENTLNSARAIPTSTDCCQSRTKFCTTPSTATPAVSR